MNLGVQEGTMTLSLETFRTEDNNCYYFFFLAWHVGSSFPNQGSNPCPLQWKHGILTTGPSGKPMEGNNFKAKNLIAFVIT